MRLRHSIRSLSTIGLALTICAAMCASGHAQGTRARAAAGPAVEPEIWFAPLQGAISPQHDFVFTEHDFPVMTMSADAWSRALSNISVMELDVVHLVEHYGDLQSIVKWTSKVPFKIYGGGSVVNTGSAMPNGGSVCTHPPMEGLSMDPGLDYEREVTFSLHRWKQAGGHLDYLGMDSPFYFGYYHVANFCHYSIQQIAERAAATMNKLLSDFPDAQIVDEEGPGEVVVPKFLADYQQFLKAFDLEAHKPISYISLDMHWTDVWHTGYDWLSATSQIIGFAHSHGIKAGLFIDAEDRNVESIDGRIITKTPVTLQSWMQMVRGHMALAHVNQLHLDYLHIASWMKFPVNNLPESSPLAFTSVVNDAFSLWYPQCAAEGRTYTDCPTAGSKQ